MPYQLILSEPTDETTKNVGENVFLDDLPSDCEVYLLYYPSSGRNEDLESKLRDLGNITSKNLFVNIGGLNDPNYKKIANTFKIKNLPVIVITATDKLASPPNEFLTAYVRMDDKRLLSSPDAVIDCVQTLFNLFMQGEVSEAIKQFEEAKRDKLISDLKGIITNALKGIGEFLGKLEINVSLIEGKLQLRKSGG